MTYTIELTKKSRKFIEKQPKHQQIRIIAAIGKLPNEGDTKPISGKKGYYRLRIGDFRIIYTIKQEILLITIINVGNRGQIYNEM